MNTLLRNKRVFNHCKKYYDDINKIAKFNTPVAKNLNYEPITSIQEKTSIGENYYMYLKINCTALEAKDFKAGDRCYVYVTKPVTHDPLCKTADYEVESMPLPTLNDGSVMLKRLSSK